MTTHTEDNTNESKKEYVPIPESDPSIINSLNGIKVLLLPFFYIFKEKHKENKGDLTKKDRKVLVKLVTNYGRTRFEENEYKNYCRTATNLLEEKPTNKNIRNLLELVIDEGMDKFKGNKYCRQYQNYLKLAVKLWGKIDTTEGKERDLINEFLEIAKKGS